MQALREAIRNALLNGDLLDEEMRQQLEQMQADGKLDELIEQIIERMEAEDYISISPPHDPSQQSSVGGQIGKPQAEPHFEVTDKASISSATARCATCSARWASPASAVTIPAIRPPESRPAAPARPMNSATR